LEEHVESDGVPGRLVPAFTAERAIGFLSELPAGELETACHEGGLDVRALYRWFEGYKTEVTSSQELIARLRALPIWPVAGEFRPLEGLFIPGGFDDPLHLSALVDVEALGGRKEFLKDLGVPELTFHVYAREQVPRVLEERPDLPAEVRRELVQLLAQRLGEIRDDWQLQRRLRGLNLVECTDGDFCPAHQVYLQSDMVKILGGRAHVAAEVAQNTEAVTALYRWLEVAEEPRPEDVLARVREFVQGPVNEEAREAVETVFEHLVNGWMRWDDEQKQQYASLQRLAWLPGTRDQKQWYKPPGLYAVFQRYLFETQASFLLLSLALQQRAGAVKLLEYLGIKDKPFPSLVVRHLLTCSEQGEAVNKAVWGFLNDNADDPALDHLKSKACLLLPDGTYVRPDQVYWGAHPFGPFRYRLDQEFQQYGNLLKRLGVREGPGDQDYIQVLVEIGEQYGGRHKPLDDDAYVVLMRCWEALSAALETTQINADDLARLRKYKVIPDTRRVLNLPQYMFFEDRAGLATKFPQFLENSVIKRPQGAWQAMAAVGVRLLGQAVEVHLVEPPDSIEDAELASRVRERRLLIDRIIESEKASGTDGLDVTALDDLRFERANELVIQYSLEAFRQKRTTDPESVPALLIPKEPTLYVVYENAHPSWPAVARELAHAIKPVGEIGGLAGGIKEALANGSLVEASRTLDALGYPPLEQRKEIEVSESGAITDFGGTEVPDQDETGYEPPVKQAETEEHESGPGVGELSPEEALKAILNGQGTARTPMPPSEPERPAGTGTPDDGGRGGDGTEAGDGKPTEPSSDGGRPRPKRKPRGKLRTYVVHDDGDKDDADTTGARRRHEVSQAGVERVLAYESACGRTPKEMLHRHEGYDVESLEAGGSVRYIEVKSLSGEWGTRNAAGLTRTQFETARKLGEQFWLYVVERATEDEARIYCIQDPANQVNQYLFDDGWEALAEVEEAN
jgi:hypothetical protein